MASVSKVHHLKDMVLPWVPLYQRVLRRRFPCQTEVCSHPHHAFLPYRKGEKPWCDKCWEPLAMQRARSVQLPPHCHGDDSFIACNYIVAFAKLFKEFCRLIGSRILMCVIFGFCNSIVAPTFFWLLPILGDCFEMRAGHWPLLIVVSNDKWLGWEQEALTLCHIYSFSWIFGCAWVLPILFVAWMGACHAGGRPLRPYAVDGP